MSHEGDSLIRKYFEENPKVRAQTPELSKKYLSICPALPAADPRSHYHLPCAPQMAKVPVNMLSNQMAPIKTKVLMDLDPHAARKGYPFTTPEDLRRQIVEDEDRVAGSTGVGALRQVQEAEEVVLRKALGKASSENEVESS